MPRARIDQLLVERGLALTREGARALVMAGHVTVAQQRVLKPGTLVRPEARVDVAAAPPYVGRGGTKLAHALDVFGVRPAGRVCLDVGASTGGFTDCLLQRGASRVYAVDVGHGQLDYRLRVDPRVVVMEGVNARHGLSLAVGTSAEGMVRGGAGVGDKPPRYQGAEGAHVSLATVDVSFISLALVIPPVADCLEKGGELVALVKPQFEAGRGKVGKGGVVRDAGVHLEVLSRLINWVIGRGGLRVRGVTGSPLLGDAGNREFFLYLVKEGGNDTNDGQGLRPIPAIAPTRALPDGGGSDGGRPQHD